MNTRICANNHKMTGIGFEDGCPECEAQWNEMNDDYSRGVNPHDL